MRFRVNLAIRWSRVTVLGADFVHEGVTFGAGEGVPNRAAGFTIGETGAEPGGDDLVADGEYDGVGLRAGHSGNVS